MIDKAQVDEYFARSTPEAAEAGRQAMDYILSLSPDITWKLNKSTIDFRAARQFCSLWPVRNHITFWITKTEGMTDPAGKLKGKARTANLKLKSVEDFDEDVKALIQQSYETEGLRPLKQ